jgi:hypothetical protein
LNRGRSKQAVGTPPAFLHAVRRRLGIADFALDLAASQETPSARSLGAQTAVLVRSSTGANWLRDSVHQRARVLLLNDRLTFVGHTNTYASDLALLLDSPSVEPGYELCGWRVAVRADGPVQRAPRERIDALGA